MIFAIVHIRALYSSWNIRQCVMYLDGNVVIFFSRAREMERELHRFATLGSTHPFFFYSFVQVDASVPPSLTRSAQSRQTS